MHYLLKPISSSLGQLALLKCKQPSLPILFSSKSLTNHLLRLISYNFVQCALLSYRHPSALILLPPNINKFFTKVNGFQSWPVSFAQVWASFITDIVIVWIWRYPLHKLITFKFGQCALLKCEHPSALMRFWSENKLSVYRDKWFIVLANALCSGIDNLQRQCCSPLNI